MSRKEKLVKRYAAELLKWQDIPHNLQQPAVEMLKAMVTHEGFENPDYKWSMANFELGNMLGEGKYGRVFLAREKNTGFIVALKTLLKSEIVNSGIERQILREIEIQTHLKHPNILQLLTWFHDDYRIYLVLEYAGKGELYKHLRAGLNHHFDEHTAAKYTYQVADAVHYCHENKVIHRDIKPENLLLTFDGNVKLGDFGWSVHAPSLKRSTMCGTLDYLCPEMVNGEEYGKSVDQWCLGVLCYEFLVGSAPFHSRVSEETYNKIRKLNVVYPSHMPDGARDLISKLLVMNGKDRLSLPSVMQHPWIVAKKQ